MAAAQPFFRVFDTKVEGRFIIIASFSNPDLSEIVKAQAMEEATRLVTIPPEEAEADAELTLGVVGAAADDGSDSDSDSEIVFEMPREDQSEAKYVYVVLADLSSAKVEILEAQNPYAEYFVGRPIQTLDRLIHFLFQRAGLLGQVLENTRAVAAELKALQAELQPKPSQGVDSPFYRAGAGTDAAPCCVTF